MRPTGQAICLLAICLGSQALARLERRVDRSWPSVTVPGYAEGSAQATVHLPGHRVGRPHAGQGGFCKPGSGHNVVTEVVTVTATTDVTVTVTSTTSSQPAQIPSSNSHSTTTSVATHTAPTTTSQSIPTTTSTETGTGTGTGTGIGTGTGNTTSTQTQSGSATDTTTLPGTGQSSGPGSGTIGPSTGTGTNSNTGPGTGSTTGTQSGSSSSSGTSTSVPTATSTGGGGSNGANSPAGKKGIDYNDAKLLAGFAGKANFAINWEQNMDGIPQGMHYYPMLWNTAAQRTARWDATAQAAIDRGDNVLLSFNEPQSDMCAKQACMEVGPAIEGWKQHMLPWKAKGAILVSPSITQGEIGAKWLSDFIAGCPPAECKIDAISLHWYEGAHQIEYFKSYMTDAHNNAAYGKLPIYVTEFAPTSGTDQEKAKFIDDAVKWMNGQDFIKGYALHWAEDATTNGQLNAMGAAYAAA